MPWSPEELRTELERLDALMLAAEARFENLLQKVHPVQYQSACNLLHYLALRSQDIRLLQEELHEQGLSSLASSESHIRSQLLAIIKHLQPAMEKEAVCTFQKSRQWMKEKTAALFGACHHNGIPCLMVTLDTIHTQNFYAVKNLLQSGMNIARINCAHDKPELWQHIIEHVKKASLQTGLPCKIFMDLPGPKIRTQVKGTKKEKEKLPVALGQHIYLADSEGTDHTLLPTITCTQQGIIPPLKIGDRVLFDDGLIEAKVVDKTELKAQLQVVRISSKKPFIKSEKGINFPDTRFFFSALTDYDRQCLPFIQEHADMVGYSFVRTVADLLQLQEALDGKSLPVVLKIETPEAVKNLPALLLQGMQQEQLGVMIARGDLAVEIGFERMSEVQEEILWICEAGHIPVVWATQVLENLNKSGVATRSEVTDAAHAAMAECVMINKGEHTLQVIDMLKDILQRSGGHHVKKRYLFRPLSIATRFMTQ